VIFSRYTKKLLLICEYDLEIVASGCDRVFSMAEEKETTEISSMTVIGIGVVLFVVIVALWYLFLK